MKLSDKMSAIASKSKPATEIDRMKEMHEGLVRHITKDGGVTSHMGYHENKNGTLRHATTLFNEANNKKLHNYISDHGFVPAKRTQKRESGSTIFHYVHKDHGIGLRVLHHRLSPTRETSNGGFYIFKKKKSK